MRRPRRAMSQINVVPYIDVMLVLLVIFMVTAPMLQPGVVNLPSVGRAAHVPVKPLEVNIDAEGHYTLRSQGARAGSDHETLNSLLAGIQRALKDNPERPVLIAADKTVRYEVVMRLMDKLQQAKVARVGLLVKPEGR